jgi:hypothetical protein
LAEGRAKRQLPTSMSEWKDILINFIKINQLPILTHKGNITTEHAKEIAKKHYNEFKIIQDEEFESDFDKMIEEIKRLEGTDN